MLTKSTSKEAFNKNSFDKINLDKSFMVGDALGRPNDYEDQKD